MNKYIAELYGTFLLVLAIVGTFIMTQSLGAPSYITLLTVALAVALVLLSNITIFSKVSGAHFNPAVSLMMYLRKNITFQEFVFYSLLQILGAVSAVVFAHLTFDFGQTSISFVSRSTNGILLSEFLATAGLLVAIIHSEKFFPDRVPTVVASYIFAATFFTTSTCFANPAVTISRIFTDTGVGINLESAMMFILVELLAVFIVSKAIN